MWGSATTFSRAKSGSAGSQGSSQENVEARPAEVSALQSFLQSLPLHESAPRAVDQHRAGLHARERRRVDQPPRRRGERAVQTHEVGGLEQAVHVRAGRGAAATKPLGGRGALFDDRLTSFLNLLAQALDFRTHPRIDRGCEPRRRRRPGTWGAGTRMGRLLSDELHLAHDGKRAEVGQQRIR